MIFQFWIVPQSATPPKPTKEFIEEPISSTVKFDNAWTDLYKDFKGKWTIYDFWEEEPCDFGPQLSSFAKALLQQPNTNGYLIIYTQFGRSAKRANKVAKVALDELTRIQNVPRKRLVTIYGGNRQEPEMELWIVPEGDKPPKPTPHKRS